MVEGERVQDAVGFYAACLMITTFERQATMRLFCIRTRLF